LEKLRPVIERLSAAGTTLLAFTGGEPALRDDFEEIVSESARGMSTLLFTSGQNLDAPRARRLREAGLEMAFISLDHYRAERHDAVRGVEGAFDRALGAIRGCIDAGLYTAAQTVVGPGLLEPGELERHLRFCAGLGVHETMLLEPIAVKPGDTAEGLSDAQRATLQDMHLRSLREAHFPKVSSSPFLESDRVFGCQAGFSFIYISAGGDVLPCDFVPCSFGNVYSDPFELILERLASVHSSPTCGCLARELSPEVHGGRIVPWDRAHALLGERRALPSDLCRRMFSSKSKG
jgi:MoaA/NifB/PqqE/SkfB family radical SAM enzyme